MFILVHTFEYKLQITNQIIDLSTRYIFHSKKKKTGHKDLVSFLKVFIFIFAFVQNYATIEFYFLFIIRYDRITVGNR